MKQFSSLQESIQENPIEEDEKEISEISDIIDKSDIKDKDKERIIACIRGKNLQDHYHILLF